MTLFVSPNFHLGFSNTALTFIAAIRSSLFDKTHYIVNVEFQSPFTGVCDSPPARPSLRVHPSYLPPPAHPPSEGLVRLIRRRLGRYLERQLLDNEIMA